MTNEELAFIQQAYNQLRRMDHAFDEKFHQTQNQIYSLIGDKISDVVATIECELALVDPSICMRWGRTETNYRDGGRRSQAEKA